jgi:hypothetical protein
MKIPSFVEIRFTHIVNVQLLVQPRREKTSRLEHQAGSPSSPFSGMRACDATWKPMPEGKRGAFRS